jgi:hypothetical protein
VPVTVVAVEPGLKVTRFVSIVTVPSSGGFGSGLVCAGGFAVGFCVGFCVGFGAGVLGRTGVDPVPALPEPTGDG